MADPYNPMGGFDLMPRRSEAQQMFDALKRIQVMGGAENMKQGPLNVTGFGGRIGYEQPIGNGNLGLGVMGGGAIGNYGPNAIKQAQVMGGDISYANGNNQVSLSHSRLGMPMPIQTNHQVRPENDDPIGGMVPSKNFTQLRWNHQF